MGVIFQATAEVTDFEQFRTAVEWLQHGVVHPSGFVSLRVLRDSGHASRITLMEEWTDADAFWTSLRSQGPTAGKEFIDRAGIEVDAFETTLWASTDVAEISP